MVRWRRLTRLRRWNSTTEAELQSKFVRVFVGTQKQRKERNTEKGEERETEGKGFGKEEGAIFMLWRCLTRIALCAMWGPWKQGFCVNLTRLKRDMWHAMGYIKD